MTLTTAGNSMIVVSIIQGKNFPIRHDKLLLVEAKFDGEVMSTDPIEHKTFPCFNTELAWEVDKKSLQMHRLQRTVIKLMFYAIDHELTRKESIGYIVLDMRVAQENTQKPTWLPLLNCKYHKEKPEVLINLFLEKDNMQNGFNGPKINTLNGPKAFNGGRTYNTNDLKRNFSLSSIPKLTQKTPETSLPHTSPLLKPILLPESSFYRIGPPDLCQENFVFSVTLAFAANLNKLAPPPAPTRMSKEFYFYYSLFENGITTGRFASLSNPDFLAERASVKILSSANLLASYFEQNSNLELFLYYGDVPLASGHIPLGPFASVNRHNIDEEPLNIERSVQMYPIEKPCKFNNDDLAPFVGVAVVLQKAKDLSPSEKPKDENRDIVSNASLRRASSCSRQASTSSNEENKSTTSNKEFTSLQNTSRQNYRRTLSQEYDTSTRGDSFFTQPTAQTPGRNFPVKSSLPIPTGSSHNRNMNGHLGNETNDNVSHHFCFSLDLSNFRATRLDHPVNVFIRYSYPFFGSSTSITTQPEIDAIPLVDVNIPNGYCSFKFSTTFNLLKMTFSESPLILEVIHSKKQGGHQEQLIGTARINLFRVLDTTSRPHNVDGKQATRRMCTCKLTVMSLEGHEIADIYAVLTLDDLGPASYHCDKNFPKPTPLKNSVSSFDVPSMKSNGYSQDDLLQAALELEVWKERQRELFRTELKEKEMQHLKVLVNEWKQRDTEREVMLQRQVQECQKLEEKLKQTLQDANLKEKQLSARENEIILRIQNLDKQKEQREKEVTLEIDKIKTEYNDLLRAERISCLDLEQKNSVLQRKIRELESEMNEQRTVIETLRSQLNKPPDIQLKTEINILRMEKNELRQKLQTVCTSRDKHKLQHSQLISQLTNLQQRLIFLEHELAATRQRLKEKSENDSIPVATSTPDERITKSQSLESPSTGQGKSSPKKQKKEEESISYTNNTIVKELQAQKELLLKNGFTENDSILQNFAAKIEEAKLASL